MKVLIALTMLLSAQAFASQKPVPTTDICERFMSCGTYVHARDPKDSDSVETKIIISAFGPMTAKFDYTLTDKDGAVSTWPLIATFQADGSAVMKIAETGQLYAVAICDKKLCTYSLRPFERKSGETAGNAGFIRFTDSTLEFLMNWGSPSKVSSNLVVLQKQ